MTAAVDSAADVPDRAAGAARVARPVRARDHRRQRRSRRASPGPPGGGGHFSLLIVSEALFRPFPARAPPARASRARRPPAASDSRALDQGADAGRISFPTTKDVSPMTRHSLTLAARGRRSSRSPAPARRRTRPQRPPRPPRGTGQGRRHRCAGGQGALPQGVLRPAAEGAHRARPARHAGAPQRASRRAQHARAARARGEEEGPRQEPRRQDADGPHERRRSWSAPTSPTG